MRVLKMLLMLLILSIAQVTVAQEDCPAIVKAALNAADSTCSSIGRNQACYGNIQLKATPREGSSLAFDKAGDIANVADLQTLQLSSMSLKDQSWGIALMRLQANLPNTLPGQNVTFLLFGNVSITDTGNQIVELPATATRAVNVRLRPNTNASVIKALKKGQEVIATGQLPDNTWIRVRLDDSSVGWVATDFLTGDLHRLLPTKPDAPAFGPMQAFMFNTGLGDRPCEQAPDSGILIQTPKGVGTIELRANNVDIQLGSTIYLQAAPRNAMYVNVIEGHATLISNGVSQVVPAGTVATIPLDAGGLASGPPQYPVSYSSTALQTLPLNIGLPIEVAVEPSISEANIPAAIDIVNGLPPNSGLWTYSQTTTHIPSPSCGLGSSGFESRQPYRTTITFNEDRSTITMHDVLHEAHSVGERVPITLYRTGETTYAASYFSGDWEITFTSPTNFSGTVIGWVQMPECSFNRAITGVYNQ